MSRASTFLLTLTLASPAAAFDAGGGTVRLAPAEAVAGPERPERSTPPETGPPAPKGIETGARDDGRRTGRRFVPNLGRSAIGVFNRDNLGPLFVGAMATGFGVMYDEQVADHLADPDNGFGRGFEDGAGPVIMGAAVAGVFAWGRYAEGPRFRAMSYDLLGAFIVNGVYTTVLKAAAKRERPNGQDNKSFPSGHTSNAFALAAVADRHYGWKVGVPAYAVASAVGISRLQRNKHHLSDVLAGATLGYIVGRTVVRVNGSPLEKGGGTTVSVTPLLGRGTRGLMVSVVF